MKKVIAVIDYGMGNLLSVSKALALMHKDVIVTDNRIKIMDASAIVLPGVGAFNDAMRNLARLKLVKPVQDAVASGKPYLGICLGLQLLFTKSRENGIWEGLNIIKGEVLCFPKKAGLKVPQIGWNSIKKAKKCALFTGVKDNSFVYFVHSYYGEPEDKSLISAYTVYGKKFASAVNRDNINAVQFHPEKSQKTGLTILGNFVKMIK
ncbi:MAG: imidazole glycerol phosphate synthase subunit HisH [Candidatus Firestonebacteria bacterium]